LVIEGAAVTIAMYCVIQFYLQLRADLKPYSPFLKVLAIKLVIFLSFWQSFLISILTSSTFNVVHTTSTIAYPDLKVGIPSLLLCIEMAIFAMLHQFAFPWKPYSKSAPSTDYPMSPIKNEHGPNQGGFLGMKAFVDAMNPWDLVKGFARGMRWLFVGVKHRETDPSYKAGFGTNEEVNLEPTRPEAYKRAESLPIAEEFRRSKFGLPGFGKTDDGAGASLIAHAQPNPLNPGAGYVPARQRYDINGQDISSGGTVYQNPYDNPNPDRLVGKNPTPGSMRRNDNAQDEDIGMAVTAPPEPYQGHASPPEPYQRYQGHVQPIEPPPTSSTDVYREQLRTDRARQNGSSPSEQWANSSQPIDSRAPPVHNALWGPGTAQRDQNQF
jgi:hypothetical protein